MKGGQEAEADPPSRREGVRDNHSNIKGAETGRPRGLREQGGNRVRGR